MEEHIYKPLPLALTIGESKIHGLGLLAKVNIPAKYFLGVTHVHSSVLTYDTLDITFAYDENNIRALIEGNHLPTFRSHVLDDDSDRRVLLSKNNIFPNGMIRTPLGGFINHSENDNCDFIYLNGGLWGIITNRDIIAGEELTLNYALTPCGVIKAKN